jgi:hypothetical protein
MPPPWQNLTHKANQQNSKLDPGINAGENTEMRKTKPNLCKGTQNPTVWSEMGCRGFPGQREPVRTMMKCNTSLRLMREPPQKSVMLLFFMTHP